LDTFSGIRSEGPNDEYWVLLDEPAMLSINDGIPYSERQVMVHRHEFSYLDQ
jgi:hypothetical protein